MPRRRPSPLRAFGGRFVIALGAAAVVMVGAVIGVNYVIDQKLDKIPRVNVTTAPELPGGANYLLIGSDSRSFVKDSQQKKTFGDPSVEQGSRSDTMMVIHVEPANKRTLIVSFPRDLWVDVPGIGKSKINSAFNGVGGGADRLIKTLENNFSIPINHYLEVDFQSFQGIVDAIGTVPVYIPEPAIDEFTGFVAINAGCYHLGGYDALQWVRTRHIKFLDPDDGQAARGRCPPTSGASSASRTSSAGWPRRGPQEPVEPVDRERHRGRGREPPQGRRRPLEGRHLLADRRVPDDQPRRHHRARLPDLPGEARDRRTASRCSSRRRRRCNRSSTGCGASTPVPRSPTSTRPTVRLRVLNGSGKPGEAKGTLSAFRGLGFQPAGTANDPRGTVSIGEIRYATGKEAAGQLVLSYVSPAARLIHDASLDGTSADVVVVLGTDFDHINAPSAGTTATVPATTATTVAGSSGSGTTGTTATTVPAEDPAAACR